MVVEERNKVVLVTRSLCCDKNEGEIYLIGGGDC